MLGEKQKLNTSFEGEGAAKCGNSASLARSESFLKGRVRTEVLVVLELCMFILAIVAPSNRIFVVFLT